MPDFNFKVSDNQKYNFLWSLLNPNYTEEGGWAIEYSICDVYDDYAVAFNYAENSYERIYYTKDDASDSLSITQKKHCYIIDVDEDEKKALDTLRKMNGDNYNNIDEKFSNLQQENLAYDSKIAEVNTTLSTLQMESEQGKAAMQTSIDDLTSKYTQAQSDLAKMTQERDELATYKVNNENNKKMVIINSYADKLSNEVLDQYTSNLDAYDLESLDMKLTYELKKAKPELFNTVVTPVLFPKDNSNKTGIEAILSRYERK